MALPLARGPQPGARRLRAALARRRRQLDTWNDQYYGAGQSILNSQLSGHERGACMDRWKCPRGSVARSRWDCAPSSALPTTTTVPTRRFPQAKDQLLGGNLSWLWKPGAARQYYATLARGYKAGGFNIGADIDPAQRRFSAETLWNLELGRARHSAWVGSSNSAPTSTPCVARSMQVYNSRQLLPNNPLTYVFYTDNAAHGDNIGIEAELHWRPHPRWMLAATGAAAETRATWDTSMTVWTCAAASRPIAPPWQLSLSAGLRASGRRVRARRPAGAGRLLLQFQPRPARTRAHARQCARRLARAGTGRRASWVRNLFDAVYSVQGFYFGDEPPDFPVKLYLQNGNPRQVGATVSTDPWARFRMRLLNALLAHGQEAFAVVAGLDLRVLILRRNRWGLGGRCPEFFRLRVHRGARPLPMQSLLQAYYVVMAVYGWYQLEAQRRAGGGRIYRWPLRRHLWVALLLLDGQRVERAAAGARDPGGVAAARFIHHLDQPAGDLDAGALGARELAVLDKRRPHHGVPVHAAGLPLHGGPVFRLHGRLGPRPARLVEALPQAAAVMLTRTRSGPPRPRLAWVPGVRAGAAPLRIERLLGGSVNESWRVDTAAGTLRAAHRWAERGAGPASTASANNCCTRPRRAPGSRPRLLLRADTEGCRCANTSTGRSWSDSISCSRCNCDGSANGWRSCTRWTVPAGILPFDPVACAREYLRA